MHRKIINVLLIEDNPGDARLAQVRLAAAQSRGWDLPRFNVTWAKTLTEGEAHLCTAKSGDADPIDVVLTDLDLPDSQAGRTFATLRGHFPYLPIVVLTGREDEDLARTTIRAGAQDYLFKNEATGSLLTHALMYALERQQTKAALQHARDQLEVRVLERTEDLRQANVNLKAEIAEHKRAEAQLRESEARYRSLFANNHAVMLLIDPNTGHIVDANPAACAYYGHSQDELTALNISDINMLSEAEVYEEMQRARREDRRHFLFRHRLANGEVRDVEVYSGPIHMGGQPLLYSIIHDVTERKQAEAEIRARTIEQEWLLKSMINAFAIFESVLDEQGEFVSYRFEYINDAYERITGVTLAEVQGKTVHEVWPGTEASWVEAYGEVAMTGVPHDFEMYHEPTGKLYACHVYRPWETNARFCVVFEDITERKLVEDQLRFPAQLLNSVGQAIIATDPAGSIIYWNQAAEALYGWPADEVMERNILDITPLEALQSQAAEIMRHLRVGESWSGEFLVQRKDGSSFPAIVTDTPVQDEEGNLVAIIGVTTDITKRKQAEQARARYAAELQRSNEALQQFAYSISHDLQEPLRTVKSFLSLLQQDTQGQLDTQAEEFVGFALDGAERMKKLIDALLNYARVDTEDRSPALTDANAVLQATLQTLHFKIEQTQATVTHDPLPTVLADPTHLEQLFQNLISNALKFQPPNVPPHIHITAKRGESTDNPVWVFSARDNGIGIPQDQQTRIFGIFQRLHTREEYEGTGIGLALCKKIVERHDGRIWVESDVGEGSTFYFTLPAM